MHLPSAPIPMSPELTRLLRLARDHKMSPEEREAQRQSWVIGEMMLEHPEMTRERALEIYREARK
jgi:hypothetical protein